MAKPRRQTYTMDMYLNKIKESDIRSDQDVQRMSGQWDKSMINELVATVLTDDYIPPIILGEEANSQLWIIDGLQRSSSLQLFRYGNYKITSAIEQPIISYRAKVKDKNGNIKMDHNGDILWEDMEINIKNKTYDDLPEELKKKFNEYQIETVIHEGCNVKQISKFVRRYNNHTAMKPAQKAFTYVDNFARDIRSISDGSFFLDCVKFTEKERINGTLERVIMETIMCMFHFDNWKKQSKQMGAYLNENASASEFETLNSNLQHLENIVTEDLKDIFTSKDAFVWLTLYDRFTHLGLEDSRFIEFLRAFKAGLNRKEINGVNFVTVDKNRSTKDKSVISEKLNILEILMLDFLHIGRDNSGDVKPLDFIKENVKTGATQEDIEFYEDMLSDWTIEVDNSSKLLSEANHLSMLGIVAYAIEKEIDLVDWMIKFFQCNDTYIHDQKENYLHMRKDLEQFINNENNTKRVKHEHSFKIPIKFLKEKDLL